MTTHAVILVSGRSFKSERAVMQHAQVLTQELRENTKDVRAKYLALGRFLLDAKRAMGVARFEVLRKELAIHRSTAWRAMKLASGVASGLVTEKQLSAPITQRSRSRVGDDGGISLREAERRCGARASLESERRAPAGARSGAGAASGAGVVCAPAGAHQVHAWDASAGGLIGVGRGASQLTFGELYEAAKKAASRILELAHAANRGDSDAQTRLAALLSRMGE